MIPLKSPPQGRPALTGIGRSAYLRAIDDAAGALAFPFVAAGSSPMQVFFAATLAVGAALALAQGAHAAERGLDRPFIVAAGEETAPTTAAPKPAATAPQQPAAPAYE